MEKHVRELLLVLEVLIANHRELLSCEHEKVECIIRQDWQGLGEALKSSEQILKSIETAEKLRRRLLGKLGHDETAPMKSLIDDLSGKQAQKLGEGAEALKSIMGELKAINGRVQELLTSSLEVINFSLSLFQGDGPGSKTYSRNGAERSGEGRYASLVLDTKV